MRTRHYNRPIIFKPESPENPVTIVHVPVVLKMHSVTREQLEDLAVGDISIHFGMFSLSVGIMTMAWGTIFTFDNLEGNKFLGFMSIAVITTLSSIYFGLKARRSRQAMKRRLEQITGETPSI